MSVRQRNKDYEIWYGTLESLESRRKLIQAEGWTVSTVQQLDRSSKDAPPGSTHYIWGFRSVHPSECPADIADEVAEKKKRESAKE